MTVWLGGTVIIPRYQRKLMPGLFVSLVVFSEKYMEYANSVAAELKKNGVDVTVDNRAEKR